jgi:hypothetical protein
MQLAEQGPHRHSIAIIIKHSGIHGRFTGVAQLKPRAPVVAATAACQYNQSTSMCAAHSCCSTRQWRPFQTRPYGVTATAACVPSENSVRVKTHQTNILPSQGITAP